MNFSVQTVYDRERLLRYQNFVALRKSVFWFVMIACTVLVTICLAINYALDLHSSTVRNEVLLIYFIDLIYVFAYFVLPRFTINKNHSLNANLIFEFQESTFKVLVTTKNATDSSELNYSIISKVMESKQDVYLFISRRQSYVLDKSGFTIGNYEDFLKFLKEKNIPYKR